MIPESRGTSLHVYISHGEKELKTLTSTWRVVFLFLLFNQKINAIVALKSEKLAFKQLANNRVQDFKGMVSSLQKTETRSMYITLYQD
jgi:hypothetical protein